MGEPNEVRPGRGEFHENPAACICKKSEDQFIHKDKVINTTFNNDAEITDDDQDNVNVVEYADPEYLHGKISTSATDSANGMKLKTEEPELEEILSD